MHVESIQNFPDFHHLPLATFENLNFQFFISIHMRVMRGR